MQSLLGKFGKDSVKNRISKFQTKTLSKTTIQMAEFNLQGMKFEDVKEVSNGASTFFAWCNVTIEALF